MLASRRWWLSVTVMALMAGLGQAQNTLPPPKQAQPPTPPDPKVIAATVNGQAIPELAVFRALTRTNAEDRARARKEILEFLIDNALIDQYLLQSKLAIDNKEAEQRLNQIRKEAGGEYDKFLKNLFLTEAELREQLVCALRWDKFVLDQGSDKVLRELFDKNQTMFDGSQVQARHILIAVENGDADKARTQIAAMKKQLQDEVGQGLAKLPPQTDKLTRERERMKILDETFSNLAAKI